MKKIILKTIKFAGFGILAIIVTLLITFLVLDEKIPSASPSADADQFARNIQEALNYQAYKRTDIISWTFRGKNSYQWNKSNQTVHAKIAKDSVFLNFSNPRKNKVLKKQSNSSDDEIIENAIANFNNDSFWVVAPFKLFDPGTKRSIITNEGGTKELLVTYTSGGTTPGDSYLWRVDENYIPISYKMWVSIIPIGGLEVTWSDWTTMNSGAQFAKTRKVLGVLEIPVSNLNVSTLK
ncbi:hypothetical protein [Aquimarina brevivitae]|uniref:Outer membrane lipoprotein-sorting protein n=1 Tax=Aquimarina brevivitae TaxID=323412 RepID=A0A4Q7P4S3_9FLAO|nr:hypothetical protein [Aquimarina brevivitae]RZS93702.1 hypothetical protein EV197_2282 [Aquimarina brevivitae]